MSRQVQFRGGSTNEHNNFIGLPREITVDTTLWTLRVHDGVTEAGNLLAKSNEVYTMKQIDDKIATIVSGGNISLDGYATKNDLNSKSNTNHSHDIYSESNHLHSEYCSVVHNHSADDITFSDGETLLYKFNNSLLGVPDVSILEHEHNEYSLISHKHNEYADKTHTHDNLADKAHAHTDYVDLIFYNNSISNKSNINHIHQSDTILFDETHNIKQYIESFFSEYSVHSHDGIYYTKEEVVSMLKNYNKPTYTCNVTVNDWQYYSISDMYYYSITHNLNSNNINLVAKSNNKNHLVDIEYLSMNELVIINNERLNFDISINII